MWRAVDTSGLKPYPRCRPCSIVPLLADCAQDLVEITAEEDLSVRLHRDGFTRPKSNFPVDIQIDEGLIEPAVGFQPGDVVAHRGCNPVWRERKIATRQSLAVRLDRD